MRTDSLSAHDIERLAEYQTKWTEIGSSTNRADRCRAERAIHMAYSEAGFESPRIVWCDSPLSMVMTRNMVAQSFAARGIRPGPLVAIQIWWIARKKAEAAIVRRMGAGTLRKIGEEIGTPIRQRICGPIRIGVRKKARMASNNVGRGVLSAALRSVNITVGEGTRERFWMDLRADWRTGKPNRYCGPHCIYGCHDSDWLAEFDYYRNVLGLIQETEPVVGLLELAGSVGWALPHEHICWISDRPMEIHRDETHRLHNTDGPAIRYPDDWGVYAMYGVPVSDERVKSLESVTPAMIEQEYNLEIRREMIDRFGKERFTHLRGSRCIDESSFGKLWHRDVAATEPPMLVEVSNATPEPDGSFNTYFLRVPPNVVTAREAVAWTFDMEAETYEPLVQT